MKEIPIGISSYKQAIDEQFLFVDKTKELLYLVKKQKFAFFSRPRRFGKSITLDAIETLFTQGLDPYFKGTYIAGNNEDGSPRWNESVLPVIRIDFSSFVANSLEDFRKLFVALLNSYCESFNLTPVKLKVNIAQAFEDFNKELVEHFQKRYVLLIDEYDAPLNALIDRVQDFESFRLEIRSFYSKIKEPKISGNIRFMLVTGITRFKDVSIFSAGSNIKDISYNPNIATIVGYTKFEIENYFKEYIDIAIEKLYGCKLTDISKADYQKYKNYLLDALAQNYDNICYDSLGKQSVFSTWSINNFFCDATDLDEIAFDDYWFENGGLPTILRKYLQNHLIDFSALKQKEIVIGKDDFMSPTALQSMDLNVLMAQTGYLSLTKGYKLRNGAVLSIPNNELRRSLSRLASTTVFGQFFTDSMQRLEPFLVNASAKDLFDKFNEILAKLPRSNQLYNFENEYAVKTAIQTFVLGAGINCYREVYESKGIPDLVIELTDKVIVVEFKYTKDSSTVDAMLCDGVNQIVSHDYGQSFDCEKQRLRLAVVYDANEKKLVAFKEC